MTARETILQALFALLQTIVGAKILRNEVLPEKVPIDGLIILRDGDAGEPEVLLSPVSYYWEHRAVLEPYWLDLAHGVRLNVRGNFAWRNLLLLVLI